MADTVVSAIELCKHITGIGKAVYDASIRVANNFKEQRRELGGKVNELKTWAERLEKKLDERAKVLEQSHNINDMHYLLTLMKELFQSIKMFFDELKEYESQEGFLKLLKKVENYYNIEEKFNDFNLMLDDLTKKMNKMQQDIGFDDLGDIRLAVHSLTQQQSNCAADFEDLKKRIAELAEVLLQGLRDQLKEFMDEYGRKLEFDEKRTSPDTNRLNRVRPHEITEEMPLSKGRYWTIHTAILDEEKVTVKRIRDVEDDNVKASFHKETVNLMKFAHGSIVRVIGMCDEDKEKFLVLEPMEKGDLSTLLHKSGEEISFSNKVKLARTAALAFYRMSYKLVHSSLGTEKFLVDKYYTAKLSGMRYAKTFSSARRYVVKNPVVDVACYLAPELNEPGEPTPEADVYGFGIVLWEIFTQTKPFSTMAKEISKGKEPNHAEVKKFIVDDKREEYDIGRGDIETKVGEIIRECRALDPTKRPRVAEIYHRLKRLENTLED